MSEKPNEYMLMFSKGCVNRKKGVVATETKVVVVSFQHTLMGMCPYLVVVGIP